MKRQNKEGRRSLLAELNFVSGLAIAGIAAIIVLCFAIYFAMTRSPKKSVIITDDARILSEQQEREIREEAELLSKRKNINVVIITTRDKGSGYSNSDEDCNQFAEDYYREQVAKSYFRDNSGICILVDLTIDVPGQRYLRIFTNGSAYYAVDNSECDRIFEHSKLELSLELYGEAIMDMLCCFEIYDFSSAAVFMNALTIIIPFVLTLILTRIFTRKKKLDPIPPSGEYMAGVKKRDFKNEFIDKKTVVTHHSSSGSGGGGGGGGGHSGGGGGRF